jgi:hypothetical protein
MKIWVPKSEILYASDMLYGRKKAPVMVHGQWLLTKHDNIIAYVPNTNTKRGRSLWDLEETRNAILLVYELLVTLLPQLKMHC